MALWLVVAGGLVSTALMLRLLAHEQRTYRQVIAEQALEALRAAATSERTSGLVLQQVAALAESVRELVGVVQDLSALVREEGL